MELLVVFLFAELLNHYLGVNVYFRFVDIRLFFIVIMGTIYGMRTGLLAALLECIALFVQYLGIGVDWTLLFYNVENCIPFMIYLMAGSVTGYIKNKKTESGEKGYEQSVQFFSRSGRTAGRSSERSSSRNVRLQGNWNVGDGNVTPVESL